MDPHIAGSDRNDELAHDLVTQWNSYGFDNVNVYNYTVLLTFPNKSSLNVLNIVSSNDFDHVLFEANTTLEKPLVNGEDNPNVVPPYNAYSGIGAVNVSKIHHAEIARLCEYGKHIRICIYCRFYIEIVYFKSIE